MNVPTLRPFPWHELESYRSKDLKAGQHIKRWAAMSLKLRPCLLSLGDMLGARVEICLRSACRGRALPRIEQGIAIDFEPRGSAAVGARLEMEVPLATRLAARALHRPIPRIHAPLANTEAESLAGSLAAILLTLGRQAEGPPVRVRAVGTISDAAGGRADDLFDTATFTVFVGDEAYLARVSKSASSPMPRAQEMDRARLRGMGVTPLEIPVVACSVRTTALDVGSWGEGDAWILGNAPGLKSLRGRVWLAAPDAEYGARAELGEDGTLVLRGGGDALSWSTMNEPDTSDAVLDAVGDVPVVVRVEVGTVRMTAREWAELAPGDVLESAQKLGDPVTLRVGGVEVARGELVEIEGQIGVRILVRIGDERAR